MKIPISPIVIVGWGRIWGFYHLNPYPFTHEPTRLFFCPRHCWETTTLPGENDVVGSNMGRRKWINELCLKKRCPGFWMVSWSGFSRGLLIICAIFGYIWLVWRFDCVNFVRLLVQTEIGGHPAAGEGERNRPVAKRTHTEFFRSGLLDIWKTVFFNMINIIQRLDDRCNTYVMCTWLIIHIYIYIDTYIYSNSCGVSEFQGAQIVSAVFSEYYFLCRDPKWARLFRVYKRLYYTQL